MWPDAFSQALFAFLVKLTDATLHNLHELKACSVCTFCIFNQELLELKKKIKGDNSEMLIHMRIPWDKNRITMDVFCFLFKVQWTITW